MGTYRRLVVSNAFSVNMLEYMYQRVKFIPLTKDEAQSHLADENVICVIGHADTARVVSDELGVDLPVNRLTVTVSAGDAVLIAQYSGARLPEGATTLPEGATIRYWLAEVEW